MHFAIRADASIKIGTGHIMRCLTLAEAIRGAGAIVDFITRPHLGDLNEQILSKGFKIHLLPDLNEAELQQDLSGYEQWLGVKQETDAEETINLLKGKSIDWLIVDHYALDQRWEGKVKPYIDKVMVIDDLAERRHVCDILLDQNLGRQEFEYLHLVPKNCKTLTGPRFALLRPEFSLLREKSLKRREVSDLRNVLITMGGIDRHDATSSVLDALKICSLPANCEITVIMGSHAPWLDRVRDVAQTMPWETKVRVNVSDMAQVMYESDLCIGAAGSTSWERCCLGVPTIILILADNQRKIANELSNNQISIVCEDVKKLSTVVKQIKSALFSFTQRSSTIVDGQGVSRILQLMNLLK